MHNYGPISGKKRTCSSNRGRRIKNRAGSTIKEVEGEVVHQGIQPKEEPKELGETEQKSREIHPFSNREVMPIRSNKTGAEEKKTSKPAKEKHVPLKMDKVVACKGVRMSRPGEEEI